MAILYTDNIFGLDTNDGLTISTPKKSINGALQIASNGDQIRVAGGSFSQLPGFITNVPRSNTVTTSQDLTVAPYGLTAGDTIGFDTTALDGWPVDYSAWLIASTTPTTITLRTNMWLPVGHGTFSVYKFGSGSQSYHYQTTLTSGAFETLTFSSIAAAAVSVSGGWNSTFDTQWGFTGVKAGVPTAVNSRNLFNMPDPGGFGFNKKDIVFDRFLFSNAKFNAGSNTFKLGIDNFIFTGINDCFGSSNAIVLGPSSSNPNIKSTIIQNGCPGGVFSNNTGAGISGAINTFDFWISSSNQLGDDSIGIGSRQVTFNQIKYRHVGNTSASTTKGLNFYRFASFNELFIVENVDVYIYATSSYLFRNNGVIVTEIKSFNLYRPDGTNCQVTNHTVLAQFVTPNQLTMTSGVVEDLRWQYPNTYTADDIISQNRVHMYVKDTEGRKSIDNLGIVRFADTSTYSVGTQSMRFNTQKNPVGATGKTRQYYIGATLKPTTDFTLSISAKTNVATLITTPIIRGDAYNLFAPSLTLSNITLTPTWTTYTYSVTLANINRTFTTDQANKTVYASDTPGSPLAYTLTIGDTQATYGTQSVYVWIGDISIY